MNALAIAQYQDGGASFVNQLKDILITIVAAKAVIDGQMTLGMMLAVQYILGQLNTPLQQLAGFVRSAQDARISLERMGEIQQQPAEDAENYLKADTVPGGELKLEQVFFVYSH